MIAEAIDLDVAPAAEQKELLRFLTCGSVDDGKSTLIGRVLYDAELVAEDQLQSLAAESRRFGTAGGDIDVSLLLDGLDDERQQRITIDVAYRFFATGRRSFIVADAPGHEQYTRNMATGASTADLAVVLVDARKGILPQTRRHSFICSLLGITDIVLAVNKMDLVGYDQAVFDSIVTTYAEVTKHLRFTQVQPIPLSALKGDNVVRGSKAMPWYDGQTFLEHLEAVPVMRGKTERPFRMPVQWVNRPHLDFRGFSGTVASGSIRAGDKVLVAGTGRACNVAEIVTFDGRQQQANAGDAVTLVLDEEIDISRGDVLVDPKSPPEVADQFSAHVLWMSESHMLAGRPYLMKIGTRTVTATVTAIRHRIDVETFGHHAARALELNEIGLCNLSTSVPVAFDPYKDDRDTGAFILIDRFTNETAGVGMIEFGLRRATNIHWQALTVSAAERAAMKHQSAATLWFTGLSGAGKSTIANYVEQKLFAEGHHTMLLDGDNVRHGLNRDLGFTDADRVENIRRVGEVAKLMNEAGLIVICSFISPFRAERQMVRELPGAGEFIEVFVDTPIEECVRRDPKGLYAKAQAGGLQNFTGIDSPYEAPENPELRLVTVDTTPERQAELVVEYLRQRSLI